MLVNTFVLKDYHTCLFLSLFFVYYVMDIENGSFAMNVETGWVSEKCLQEQSHNNLTFDFLQSCKSITKYS